MPAPSHFQAGSRAEFRTAERGNPFRYIIGELQRNIGEMIELAHMPKAARVLDFGCADQPYRGLLPAGCDYQGADLPGNPRAGFEILPDGRLPLPDASFDLVLSTQVLEHVTDPALYLAECRRVLRPGGSLLLTTHGIMLWHPDPIDRWRWTCEGLRHIVAEAGFSVEQFRGIMGLSSTALQLFQQATLALLPRLLHRPYASVMQFLVRICDRCLDKRYREYNALVFALTARKPGIGE